MAFVSISPTLTSRATWEWSVPPGVLGAASPGIRPNPPGPGFQNSTEASIYTSVLNNMTSVSRLIIRNITRGSMGGLPWSEGLRKNQTVLVCVDSLFLFKKRRSIFFRDHASDTVHCKLSGRLSGAGSRPPGVERAWSLMSGGPCSAAPRWRPAWAHPVPTSGRAEGGSHALSLADRGALQPAGRGKGRACVNIHSFAYHQLPGNDLQLTGWPPFPGQVPR